MTRLGRLLLMAVVLLTAPVFVWGDEVLLIVEKPPADGLVVAHVDLTAAARRCQQTVEPAGLRATTGPAGQNVPIQLVPDADYDAEKHIVGTLVLRFPAASDGRVRLGFTPGVAKMVPWNGRVEMRGVSLTHDAKRQGGFPSQITFADGKALDSLRWNDRLYHRQLGGFSSAADPQAKVTLVAKGPLSTAVRVTGRYMQAGGKAPPSAPQAVYDWLYLADRPLVLVRATITQTETFSWPEVHFLELNYPREAMPQWAGGEPMERGQFTASNKSFGFSQWARSWTGPGQSACSSAAGSCSTTAAPARICKRTATRRGSPGARRGESSLPGFGSELPPSLPRPFARQRRDCQPPRRLRSPSAPCASGSSGAVRAGSPAASRAAGRLVADRRGRAARSPDAVRGSLAGGVGETSGRLDCVERGDLGLALQRAEGGVRLASLYDSSSRRQLLAPQVLPLFDLTLRHVMSKETLQLKADAGWTECEVTTSDPAKGAEIRWQRPAEKRLEGLRVVAQILPGPTCAFHWRLKVEGVPAEWSVWKLRFPQLAVADLGRHAKALLPRGAGELQQDPWQRTFPYRGTYPSGWTSMQLLAAYDADGKAGLYVAMHDPSGSTKDIVVESQPAERAVTLAFEHPAANMGVGGNGFELSGEAVWQLLRGDWFDAAVIYRDWVRRSARWYPRWGPRAAPTRPYGCGSCRPGPRPADPRRVCRPGQGVPEVPRRAGRLPLVQLAPDPLRQRLPALLPGQAGVRRGGPRPPGVGRVRDALHQRPAMGHARPGPRGLRVHPPGLAGRRQGRAGQALHRKVREQGNRRQPGATGSHVPDHGALAKTMGHTVLRLFGECGVKGVYVDQIAAANPSFASIARTAIPWAAAIGGPKATGPCWSRSARPNRPRMLTTECNAEPYAQVFDGYLTWHWQFDGQVPVFPAVYGGAIQMFGRAYRGGPTKDLALRMKAGQQLVYGEQIGWLDPGVIHEKGNADFLRQVVRLRHALRRTSTPARWPDRQGCWNRPPGHSRLAVGGHWPVTTDALLVGAWRLPRENK